MGAKLPWWQFNSGEFFDDPTVQFMSDAAVLAYLRLLHVQWRERSLPDDVRKLAVLARRPGSAVPIEEFEHDLWPQMAEKFPPHPTLPGRLANGRLELDRQDRERDIDNGQAGGLASGEARRRLREERDRLENERSQQAGSEPSASTASIDQSKPGVRVPFNQVELEGDVEEEEREPSVQYTAPAPEPPPPAPLSPESRLEPEPGTPDPEIQRARDAVRTEIRARTGGVDPPVKKRDADAFDGLVRRHGADAVIGRAVTFWRYRRPPGLADRGSVPGIGWFVRHFAEIEPAGASEPPPAPGAPRRAEPYVEPPPRATPEQQARTNREGLAQLAAALGRTAPAQPSGPSEPSGPTPPPHTERPSRRRARRGDERLSDPDRALGERQRDSVNALRKSIESPAASPMRNGVEREASVAEPARPP